MRFIPVRRGSRRYAAVVCAPVATAGLSVRGSNSDDSSGSDLARAGAELFKLAAEKVEGDVTSAKLIAARNSLEDADPDGIVGK
ncbi:MAG TPA: hypothetical protein VNT55_05325 [Baekduia sp.]|nr:hypothetical protein [Baekduia sp.]